MLVFVPKKADGLAALEEKLTAKDVDAWIGNLESETVLLGFPRFKITSRSDLNRELTALGMKDAFRLKVADITGMSETKELYVGLVLHKVFVDVNEEGTEAAAATAVLAPRTGGVLRREIHVQVDRPFAFLIRDAKSGMVLFVGRVLRV